MFHRGFQTLENNKSTRPANPDETLALVFEILRGKQAHEVIQSFDTIILACAKVNRELRKKRIEGIFHHK